MVAGGIFFGAHAGVKLFPVGLRERRVGGCRERPAEGAPGLEEVVGAGVKGGRAGDKGVMEGEEVAALGFVGAQIQAADASVGGQRDP